MGDTFGLSLVGNIYVFWSLPHQFQLELIILVWRQLPGFLTPTGPAIGAGWDVIEGVCPTQAVCPNSRGMGEEGKAGCERYRARSWSVESSCNSPIY